MDLQKQPTQEELIFSEIKPIIVEALNTKLNDNKLHITEKVTLIDGFTEPIIVNKTSKETIIGGNRITMIMLVGDESGQIYYFSLKTILPDLVL